MAQPGACEQAVLEPLSRGSLVSRFALEARELHVWFAHLDHPTDVSMAFAASLSPDEIDRADRFRYRRDADRYVVGRGLLRGLLGQYLGADPRTIALSYTEYGKPMLADGSSSLTFNLSHSDDLVVYAFCLGSEIGVDIERLHPEVARERIAEHFFSPGEVATLRALPAELQPRAFLTCWTRKEAFVKARGDGLQLPLDAFVVTFSPGDAPALTRTAWAPEETSAWSIYDLSSSIDEHVAALAVEQGAWSLVVNAPLKDAVDMIQIGKEHAR